MSLSIDRMIDDVLRREGGFVDHPADRGGPTKYGITLRTLERRRRRPVTVDEVRELTEEEARAIYLEEYFLEPRLDRIRDPYVACLAFDAAVNHGPRRAVRWLQQSVGVTDDGELGPVTEAAVNSADPVRLYQKALARRVRFYGELIAHDPELRRARRAGYALQAEFAAGWLNRAASFVEV